MKLCHFNITQIFLCSDSRVFMIFRRSILSLCGCVSETVIVYTLVSTCGCGQSKPDLAGGRLPDWQRTVASLGLFSWVLAPCSFPDLLRPLVPHFPEKGCAAAYSSSSQSWPRTEFTDGGF